MKLPQLLSLLLSTLLVLVHANVEKVIFVTPPADTLSLHNVDPRITALERLSPTRTSLKTSFLSHTTREISYETNSERWILLEDLRPDSRYEVRICWPAIQPADFTLRSYSAADLQAETSLSGNLKRYLDAADTSSSARSGPSKLDSSSLLLQITVRGDYLTTNTSIMARGVDVYTEIILDRYLLNIFPESLVPTAIYMLGLAVFAYFFARFVVARLKEFVEGTSLRREGDVKKVQ